LLRRRKQLPFRLNADGTHIVGLDTDSRDFLADLPKQLMAVIEDGDVESTRRLFPPAYHREIDAEHQEEYQRFMRDDLIASKRGSLTLLSETAHHDTLTSEQLLGWMGAVNDIRLVLGTQLDVYEGLDLDDLAEDDPRRPALAVYTWLSGILELIVLGLSPRDDSGDDSGVDSNSDDSNGDDDGSNED
jgi:hypothetical protein